MNQTDLPERESAYPASIQAGLPKLAETPEGWARFPLRKLLHQVERPISLLDDEAYRLVTAKRSRVGIVAREVLRGSQIRTKSQFSVQTDDFLISNRQISHGACGIVPAHLSGSIISNEYTAFRVSPSIDLRYLRALSHSIYFQQTCFHSSIGIHVEKLVFRIEEWMNWEFNIPPIAEQTRIVAVLDAWDQAITSAELLLSAKKQRYRGLLNRLSGPAFFDQESDGWVPLKMGSVFQERDERSADLPLLSITGTEGVVPREALDRRLTASEDKSKYKIIRPDDIGYNTMRMWQGVFGRSKRTGIVSPAYTVITARQGEIDPVFASHLFAHPRAISLFHRYSQGLVDDTLMLKFPQFSEVMMRLPNFGEQVRIGKILEAEYEGLRPQAQYVLSLRSQKRGLMQKLLTGEWRLDERFDPPVPAVSPVLAEGAV